MRKLSGALWITAALILMAGCNGTTSSSGSALPTGVAGQLAHGAPLSAIPPQYLPKHLSPVRGPVSSNTKGIYVAAFGNGDVYGFPKNNSGNGPATCTVTGNSSVNNIGVDNVGNLMVPSGGTATVNVYQGPSMCGSLLGSVSDTYGQPADASSVNAATGTIAVGNLFPGSVTVCTLASGCTANLTNSSLYEVGGVAIAPNGDCWADGITSSDTAVLVYFQGCTGSGTVASGFTNNFYGGIDLDNKGNLVTVSLFGPSFSLPSVVNVYSGCNPSCTLLSSTKTNGESIFGHVGKQNERFLTTNLSSADVEVYKYNATSGLTFDYSFTGGIPCATYECEGSAYSPSSKK